MQFFWKILLQMVLQDYGCLEIWHVDQFRLWFKQAVDKLFGKLKFLMIRRPMKSLQRIIFYQFHVTTWYKQFKSGGNYRQIISLKNINACEVLENINKFPQFVGYVDWLNITFQGLFHPCPYTASAQDLLSFNTDST